MHTTTNLDEAKRNLKDDGIDNFTWGKVVRILEIGPYSIIEVHPWCKEGHYIGGAVEENEIEYHCYVDGHSLSQSTDSLDHALAVCIAYRNEDGNRNSQAARYFMKMIGA